MLDNLLKIDLNALLLLLYFANYPYYPQTERFCFTLTPLQDFATFSEIPPKTCYRAVKTAPDTKLF